MAKVGFSSGNRKPSTTKATEAPTAPQAQVPATVTHAAVPEVSTIEEARERPSYSPQAYKDLDMAEYRGRFAEETKALSDKQLFDVVVGTDDDLSDDDWRSLFRAAANPNVPDGDTLAAHAIALGEQASTIMNQTAIRLAVAREDWQGGPIYTLLALRSTYDEETLASFPIPGSETGNNPDRFSITTMKGDKKGTKKTTFYAQFTRGTTEGKAVLERLDWLERAADKGAVKDGIPEDILELTPDGRDTQRSFLEGRLNTMTQAYKKAMELHFQFLAVNSYHDNIVAEPIWVDGKSPDDVDETWQAEVVRTAEPITVYYFEEGKPVTKWEHFSIGAFLKLKPKTALENGGGFKKLIESGATKKPPKQPGTVPTATEGDTVIKTVDKGIAFFVEAHRWMTEIASARDGAEYGKLVQQLTAKNADEYVTAFVELKNYMIDVAKNNGLDAKYVKLKSAGSDLVSDTKVPAKAS